VSCALFQMPALCYTGQGDHLSGRHVNVGKFNVCHGMSGKCVEKSLSRKNGLLLT